MCHTIATGQRSKYKYINHVNLMISDSVGTKIKTLSNGRSLWKIELNKNDIKNINYFKLTVDTMKLAGFTISASLNGEQVDRTSYNKFVTPEMLYVINRVDKFYIYDILISDLNNKTFYIIDNVVVYIKQ
jgi:hypothetical protein